MENLATEPLLLLQEDFTEYIEENTDDSMNTAHRISQDPWYQVAFILITSMNSAYVLGYSGIVMVPLGWVAGILGFTAAAFISFYANYLLARLHQIDGLRHIRYRDLVLVTFTATIKRPYVRNMHKALYLQFLMGNVPIYVEAPYMNIWIQNLER